MLDKRTEMMLQVASTLTAEDLDYLRGTAPAIQVEIKEALPELAEVSAPAPEKQAVPVARQA